MSDLNYMDEDVERLFSPGDFDFDYDFDAPRFYDFALPETELEVREAEFWFDSAGSYPPSPFVVKLKQRLEIGVEIENEEISSGSDHEEGMNSPSDQGLEAEEVCHNIFGVKTYLPKSSTLFKPTLSHLAKKVQSPNADSESIRRFHELLVKIDKKVMKLSPLAENQASKRQKLETGYSSKVAHLKHQSLFQHKNQKNGSFGSGSSRSSQATVPKGPELETAQRAQRRSKIEAESKKDGISAPYFFKARPLNRKIFKSPSLSFPKRSALPTTEFQAFHLRTSERAKLKESNAKAIPNYVSASRNDTAEPRSLRSFATLKEDKNAVHSPRNEILITNSKAGRSTQPEMISPDSTSREHRLKTEPPAELFSQMTLSAEDGSSNVKYLSRVLSSKGRKENTPVQSQSLGRAAGARYKSSAGRSNEARRRICNDRY